MTTSKSAIKMTGGRVFSYDRWSSDGQSGGDSYRRQSSLAQEQCKRRGLTLADDVYVDAGVSAWKGKNRKEGALARLLKVVRAGDAIAVEDLDRWSREPVLDSLNALRDVISKGVEVWFLKTGVIVNKNNFNDAGTLIPTFIQGFLANQENEKRAYRIREAMAGKRQKLAQGKLAFGRLPAWLKWSAQPSDPNRTVSVDKAKAAVVRSAFKLCLSGMGCRAIAIELSRHAPISNHPRSSWNARFIHRLITDKSVLGYFAGTEHKVLPAIVDETVFFAAASRLKTNKTYSCRIDHRNSSLFTGVVKCSDCGEPMVRFSSTSGGKRHHYLICSGYWHKKTSCGFKAVNYGQMETSFLALLEAGELIQQALAGEKQPSKLDALEGELLVVQAQANKLLKLIEGDDDPSTRLVASLKAQEALEKTLKAEIEAEKAKAFTFLNEDANRWSCSCEGSALSGVVLSGSMW
jgi:DNA invertase Pin-like site-specific DNA recombinase